MVLKTEIHRTILFSIVQDIFKSNIWKYLAFKWWTACYFLYSLDRFSTDLDFDLLDQNVDIDTEIIEIISKYWKVKKWNKIILSYGENDVNIKIDISRKVWKANKYEVINFYWNPIKVQTKATIFANKLVAFLERWANRDIYDIYFFLKNAYEINENVVLERTGKNLKEVLIEVKEKLQKLPKNYNILDWLWEIFTAKQKDFVKKNLVWDLIWLVDFKIKF